MTNSVPEVELVDRAVWLRESQRFRDLNYRQTWAFASAGAERVNATNEAVLIRDGHEVVGATNVRIKRIPFLRGGIAYITGGPLSRGEKWDNKRSLDAFAESLRALAREYVEKRHLTLRAVAPCGPEEWNENLSEIFESHGFARTERARDYFTIVLDLTRPLEDVRRSFLQKWRNCLNKSERQNLEVDSGTDIALLERFSALFGDFIDRKGFSVDLDPDFYTAVQRNHATEDQFFISIAVQDGIDTAGHVSSMDGDTCVYLLGASTPAAMKTNAAYLLQWKTIVEARERGMHWYDLGGIDPAGNPGVYKFKRGLNGREVRAAGPYELRPRGTDGLLTNAAETLYRHLVQKS